MITYQANCIEPTHAHKQAILRAVPLTTRDASNSYQVELQYPGNTGGQVKWKWALVFGKTEEVNWFIEELEQSEEKQFRLGIEEYSVFGNVMFVFLKKQVKLHIWCSHIKDLVRHLPLGAFIFGERFKHLVDLVEKGVEVYYRIDWKGLTPARKPLVGEVFERREDSHPLSDSESCKVARGEHGAKHSQARKKRGRPRKADQVLKQKLIEESIVQRATSQDLYWMGQNKNVKDGYLELLENLNKRYQRRHKRARLHNDEMAIKFEDFGECLLSVMDDQNYFVKGFYECLSQLKRD